MKPHFSPVIKICVFVHSPHVQQAILNAQHLIHKTQGQFSNDNRPFLYKGNRTSQRRPKVRNCCKVLQGSRIRQESGIQSQSETLRSG